MQWDRFVAEGLTLFMAVPTVYVKLIAHYDKQSPERQKMCAVRVSTACH